MIPTLLAFSHKPGPIGGPFAPLEHAAIWMLDFFHDTLTFGWGLSIVALTIFVRALILPLSLRQIRSMRAMQALQPQLKELQAKHKDDKQRLQQEMMKFYKENNVNPLASCLPLLLQLPVFIALYGALRSQEFADRIHATVAAGGNEGWLFINALDQKAVGATLVVLVILYVGTQLAAGLVMASATADRTQRMIMIGLPIFFVPFIIGFPAGLVVYWITTNTWTIGQQLLVKRMAPPPEIEKKLEEREKEQSKPPPPPRKRKRKAAARR